jgi:hypothetical protein
MVKKTNTGSVRMSRAVYDPPIREAIRAGDLDQMKALLKEAKAVRSEQGDLDAAIRRLEEAIKKAG